MTEFLKQMTQNLVIHLELRADLWERENAFRLTALV